MTSLKNFFLNVCNSEITDALIDAVNSLILDSWAKFKISGDLETEAEINLLREFDHVLAIQKDRLRLLQTATDIHKNFLISKNLRNQASLVDSDKELAEEYDKIANDYYKSYEKVAQEAEEKSIQLFKTIESFDVVRLKHKFSSINLN